jgi:hypothetical protein
VHQSAIKAKEDEKAFLEICSKNSAFIIMLCTGMYEEYVPGMYRWRVGCAFCQKKVRKWSSSQNIFHPRIVVDNLLASEHPITPL